MKTTILGIITIVGALCNATVQYLNGKQIDLVTLSTAITAGWGLIHAADTPKA